VLGRGCYEKGLFRWKRGEWSTRGGLWETLCFSQVPSAMKKKSMTPAFLGKKRGWRVASFGEKDGVTTLTMVGGAETQGIKRKGKRVLRQGRGRVVRSKKGNDYYPKVRSIVSIWRGPLI